MASVTARIKAIKQPKGGYINPKMFAVIQQEDGQHLNDEENVHSSIVGMVVDYMTRFMMGAPANEAFSISILGAKNAALLEQRNAIAEISEYLSRITGLDDTSLQYACKAVTFDVWYRNPMQAAMAKPASETNADAATAQNIRILVERSLRFWKEYGPITEDGFTFEPFGYTQTVSSGDGDFLTQDTMWDFKVSKSDPTNKHTLQILMYWIMGQHSKKECFRNISKLGFFNPRLNKIYLLDIADIPRDVISVVEKDVICY